MMTTRKATKLETEAMNLFGVSSVGKIPAVLWALGLREACTRCLGSGHYSRNSFGSTTCYRCNGRRESAAKLTRPVLEQARAKVAAGELDAARARGKARTEARKMVARKISDAETICSEIGAAYAAGSLAIERMGDEQHGLLSAFVAGPVYRAQTMKHALFYRSASALRVPPAQGGMHDIRRGVEFDGLDPVKACALLDERVAMLAELRDAWRAWEASQRARLRAAARARLAA